MLKGFWCTEANHLSNPDDEWDCITCIYPLTSSPFHMVFWHGLAILVNLVPEATAKPLSWVSASEVKHVSGARDEAREQEMSQMNTCQVMSSPVSIDDWPQLFWCTEAQAAAPVWGSFSSHTTAAQNGAAPHWAFVTLQCGASRVQMGQSVHLHQNVVSYYQHCWQQDKKNIIHFSTKSPLLRAATA